MSENKSVPSVYVGTYGKYNSGSLEGEWVDLTQFSDREEFYEYCKELHNDEDDAEFMFQDWEYIPDGMIGESWIEESLWDLIPFYEEYGYDLVHDVMNECSLTDADEFESAMQNASTFYTDSVSDAVQMFCEEVEYTDNPEWCARYFDMEKWGRDIRLSGDLDYELEDIEDEEERAEREEELYNMSDYEIGEYFLEIMGGDVTAAVRESQLSYYIDWDQVEREFGWDATFVETNMNGDDVVVIVWNH